MRYNIHDIIKIESFTEILELKYFKEANENGGNNNCVDMSIGNDVSDPTYSDILCSLSIEPGRNTYLGVSKLLESSKHVLYVNLVEPLLRLLLVPKGYALLHLAVLEKDGKAMMISAPPDTGKTSLILKCLKSNANEKLGLSLLSDDMVIASEKGELFSFPKPFTISSHTLDAVFGMDTNLWYKVRSNVHSGGGRSAYKGMGKMSWLPMMSINALAQIVFEPPKLYPEELVNVKIGKSAIPESLTFLSKEFNGEKPMERKDAAQLIRSNTDNAYITPPYDKIFPGLAIGDMSYEDILAKEMQITENLIKNITPMEVGRKDYSWYEYVLNGYGRPPAY
jgi:hypothetical protein